MTGAVDERRPTLGVAAAFAGPTWRNAGWRTAAVAIAVDTSEGPSRD